MSLPIPLHICIYLTLFIRLRFQIRISDHIYITNILDTCILPSGYLATRGLLLWDWFLKGGIGEENTERHSDQLPACDGSTMTKLSFQRRTTRRELSMGTISL